MKSLAQHQGEQLRKLWSDAARQAALESRKATATPDKTKLRALARHKQMDRIDANRARVGLKPYFDYGKRAGRLVYKGITNPGIGQ